VSLFHQLLLAFGRVILALALDALEPRVALVEAVAREYQIEPARLLATCFVESGLRIRNTRAIFCGCGHHVEGDRAQAECAAMALLIGHKRCGTWRMSHNRYQSGRCVPVTPVTRRYARNVSWALEPLRAAGGAL